MRFVAGDHVRHALDDRRSRGVVMGPSGLHGLMSVLWLDAGRAEHLHESELRPGAGRVPSTPVDPQDAHRRDHDGESRGAGGRLSTLA